MFQVQYLSNFLLRNFAAGYTGVLRKKKMIPPLAYATIRNDIIYYFRPFRVVKIKAIDLCEVNYHYHAVVGFVAVWEFVDNFGKSIDIDSQTIGIKSVLSDLDRKLSDFNLKQLEEKFEKGDVVDILNIYRKNV